MKYGLDPLWNIYIKKEDLDDWKQKLFNTDLISIEELLNKLDELGSEKEELEEQLKDTKENEKYLMELLKNESYHLVDEDKRYEDWRDNQ